MYISAKPKKRLIITGRFPFQINDLIFQQQLLFVHRLIKIILLIIIDSYNYWRYYEYFCIVKNGTGCG
jgi:hypothetical protein